MPGVRVRLYECMVTGVSPENRVINARSRSGKQFTNCSYLLPYMNLRGSGLDYVPQSGDQCLILSEEVESRTIAGGMKICIGFKLPVTPNAGGLELGGRNAEMTPGSIGIRAKGEDGSDAHVTCFAGGTLVLGSGQSAATLYSPLDKSIINIFGNFQMLGPGGHVKWLRESGSDAVSYEALYRTNIDEDSDDLEVSIKIGVDENPLEISVNKAGLNPPPLRVWIDPNGEANIEGQVININGQKQVNIDGGTVTIKGKQVLSEKDPV